MKQSRKLTSLPRHCSCQDSSSKPIWRTKVKFQQRYEKRLQARYFDSALVGAAEVTGITFKAGSSYGQRVAFGPLADRRRARYLHVLLYSAAPSRRRKPRQSLGWVGCRIQDRYGRRQLPHRGPNGVPLRQGWRLRHVRGVQRRPRAHLVRQFGPDRFRGG
jgi:hypothetical protein